MRILIAGLVAAVIVFVWGFIAWGALRIWYGQFRPLTNHAPLVQAIGVAVPESGVYFFPPLSTVPEPAPPEVAAREAERHAAEYRSGPIGVLVVRREGGEPFDPMAFVRGPALSFVAGLLMATVLTFMARCGATWRERFAAGLAMALFAALTTRGSDWTWFAFPADYSLALSVDLLVGWGLAAAAVATIVVETRSVARLRRA